MKKENKEKEAQSEALKEVEKEKTKKEKTTFKQKIQKAKEFLFEKEDGKIFIMILTVLCIEFLMYFLFDVFLRPYPYKSFNTILFTFIIFLEFYFAIFLMTKSTKVPTIVLGTIVIVLSFINHLRYIYSGEVITVSDLAYASNAGQIATLMKDNIVSILLSILPMYLGAATFVALLVCLDSHNKCKLCVRKKPRIIISIVLICLIVFIFLPIPGLKDFMLKHLYRQDKEKDYRHKTLNVEYYGDYGLFGGIYWSYLEGRLEPRDDYNPEEMIKILNEVSKETEGQEKPYGKPNIIVTFSESFYDINKISDDVKFNKDVTPNLHRLAEVGVPIETISPTYGGMSINVEFQLLTGYSCNFFSKGYSPFLQLYRNDRYIDRPTILKELANNGYKSKVVFGRDYFKSEKFYKKAGMQDYEVIDINSDKNAKKGYYTSDEYLMTNVIKTLENKPKDERLFHMTCTMQSHMPFYLDKYKDDEYDIYVESSTLDRNKTDALLSYAQGCYDADEQLGRMYDFIQSYDEPTVLIFFGDHLPYIPDVTTQEDTLNYLQYFNTDDELLNMYRRHNTQGIILANFDLGDTSKWHNLSSDMIVTKILNNMDIELSDYYKYLNTTSEIVPATNKYVTADTEGNLYWTDKLEGKMKETLDTRANMQYKVLLDEN